LIVQVAQESLSPTVLVAMEQAFALIIFMLLLATAFGKNVPEYGAWCKSCTVSNMQ